MTRRTRATCLTVRGVGYKLNDRRELRGAAKSLAGVLQTGMEIAGPVIVWLLTLILFVVWFCAKVVFGKGGFVPRPAPHRDAIAVVKLVRALPRGAALSMISVLIIEGAQRRTPPVHQYYVRVARGAPPIAGRSNSPE